MLRHVQIDRRTLLKSFALIASSGITMLASACGDVAKQDVLSLEISCDGNNMAFSKTTLTAPAGQIVEVSFHNISTVFQHNWVLVDGGEEVANQVYESATAAGPKLEYIPTDTDQILAYTQLTSQGESSTVQFTTPTNPGEYIYLCTFPGHYLAGMKGTFVITA